MNAKIKPLLVLLLLLCAHLALGQKTKQQLQKEKLRNLEKIKETEKILNQTAAQKKNSLGELTAINRRIQQQENLISSTRMQIELLDADIAKNNEIVNSLQSDLKKLKEEYRKMLYAAQKSAGKADKLSFLFAAKSFDQFIARIKYMEQYSKARQKQADAIQRMQENLMGFVKTSESKKKEMQNLLQESEEEKQKMGTLQEKQRELIQNLEKEEVSLRDEIRQTKKAIIQLEAGIAKIIREEIQKAEREASLMRAAEEKKNRAKNKGAKPGTAPAADKTLPVMRLSPELVALSNNFEENKGKLPWPVNGFITQQFGKHPHPALKNIIIENDGVSIQSSPDEPVKVIFEGEVRAIQVDRILGQSVIVRHGAYFTIYSCLKNVVVKPGQKVKRGEMLGQLILNLHGTFELRLMIWKSIAKLDPEEWLDR